MWAGMVSPLAHEGDGSAALFLHGIGTVTVGVVKPGFPMRIPASLVCGSIVLLLPLHGESMTRGVVLDRSGSTEQSRGHVPEADCTGTVVAAPICTVGFTKRRRSSLTSRICSLLLLRSVAIFCTVHSNSLILVASLTKYGGVAGCCRSEEKHGVALLARHSMW